MQVSARGPAGAVTAPPACDAGMVMECLESGHTTNALYPYFVSNMHLHVFGSLFKYGP